MPCKPTCVVEKFRSRSDSTSMSWGCSLLSCTVQACELGPGSFARCPLPSKVACWRELLGGNGPRTRSGTSGLSVLWGQHDRFFWARQTLVGYERINCRSQTCRSGGQDKCWRQAVPRYCLVCGLTQRYWKPENIQAIGTIYDPLRDCMDWRHVKPGRCLTWEDPWCHVHGDAWMKLVGRLDWSDRISFCVNVVIEGTSARRLTSDSHLTRRRRLSLLDSLLWMRKVTLCIPTRRQQIEGIPEVEEWWVDSKAQGVRRNTKTGSSIDEWKLLWSPIDAAKNECKLV